MFNQETRALMGLAAITLLILGSLLTRRIDERAHMPVMITRTSQNVMGDEALLAAVIWSESQRATAEKALNLGEQALRSAQTDMDYHNADSQLARLNRAGVGEEVYLSSDTMQVLRKAREAYEMTDGAFDVTAAPLLELWKQAAGARRLPDESAVTQARQVSRWDLIDLTDRGAVKLAPRTRINLGGVAKGYAIDQAVRAMIEAGLEDGMVDVGGDLVCFGRPPEGDAWVINIRHPFDDGLLGSIRIAGGAVSTSGANAHYTELDGMRISDVIDPRSGHPAQDIALAAVIAPEATTADIWATTLRVLGEKGFEKLPPRYEAFMVAGDPMRNDLYYTEGFQDAFVSPMRLEPQQYGEPLIFE